MIVPEKLILITSDIYSDARVDALEKFINGNVFGYHIIKVQEQDINPHSTKIKNKTIKYLVKQNISTNVFDKLFSLKVKNGIKKIKHKKKNIGKYKRINNLVKRFNAKAIFCMNETSLYSVIRAREKFGFGAKIIFVPDTFTFDKANTLLGADKYIVENFAFKDSLAKQGVEKDNIIIQKFPLKDSAFFDESILECKQMFNLEGNTIMLNGSSIGCKKIIGILKILIEIKDRFNIVVYLGENEKLYERLSNYKEKNNLLNVRLFTNINNFEKLFFASDLIISVYDINVFYLAKIYNKQLIVFAPNRDIEQKDYEYLSKHNELVYSKDVEGAVTKVFKLINNDNKGNIESVEELKSSTVSFANCIIDLIGKVD